MLHALILYNDTCQLFFIKLEGKKREILAHVTTWMNIENNMLSEINQSQRTESSLIQRDRNGACQGLRKGGNEELLFNGDRVSVVQG